MTAINLLPSEIRTRQRTKRHTVLVAVAGAAVVGGLVFLWFLQGVHLSQVDQQVADQKQTNAQLQVQIDKLHHFAEIRNQLETRKQLLHDTLGGTVEWSGVLHDLSLVMPQQMWLSSMTGTVNTAAAGSTGAVPATAPSGTGATSGKLVGSIQFEGDAMDKETVALWLTKLETVRGWVNSWLSQLQETTVGVTPVVSFSTSIDLSKAATKNGGKR
jgi:Tfp pilus assembly protein PilN